MFRRLLSIRNLFGVVQNSTMSTEATNASALVEVEKLDKIMTIGINRPDKRNCVNMDVAEQLVKAFEQFENDSDAHVAVFYGKGGNFCAGMDLEEVSKISPENAKRTLETYLKRGPMGPSRMAFTKPVIGAISGYAVAGGLELALLADVRIMEDTAVMGIFCRRFGVPLIDGGTVRLPQLIGLPRALDMILTGRPVKAQEALSWGLANYVCATGSSLGEAIKYAKSLLKYPQECMRADRNSAYSGVYNSTNMNDALHNEFSSALHVITAESVEGAKRFVSGVGKHGSFKLDEDVNKPPTFDSKL